MPQSSKLKDAARCRYSEQLTVASYQPGVDVRQAFDRAFHLRLVEVIFAKVLPLLSELSRERCLNIIGRRSLKTRWLRTRYGYDSPHSHAHVEIALVIKGTCRFLMQDRVYVCRPGDVVFVPPYQPHVDAYKHVDAGYELLWFLLYDNFYSVSWAGFTVSESLKKSKYFYNKRIVTIPIGNVPAWVDLRDKQTFELDSLRELLLYLAYRTVMILRRAPSEHKNHLLMAAQKRVDQDFDKPLAVSGLAEELNITPNYLSALFTQSLGISFRRYLQETRLNHAQLLLQNPALSIKEIADVCGFKSTPAFNHLFRKVFAMTPTAYRSSVSRKDEPLHP